MIPPAISNTQVLTLLRERLGLDISGVETLRPGAWSSVFAYAEGHRRWVIRFSNHGDDFDRDAYAFRFWSPDLPVPEVTHRGSLDGISYAVSQRVPGDVLDKLDRADYERTLPSLLGTLNALRIADVTSSTGYGGWDSSGNGMATSWPGHLRASLEDSPDQRGGGWRPRLEQSPTGAHAFDRDVIVLERMLKDMPNVRHVIHSDLLNYNAFVSDHHLSGVIDWGCAMYGDFLYELAWFEFWSPWYPKWQGISVATEAHRFFADLGVDLHNFHERLLCYQLHIGLSHQAYNASIGRWDDLADVTRHTVRVADRVR